ncbi:hypothetical protein POM88_027148 [Heracleum sosnowskyi]|uniref:BED-type domain-containing protein n=1 Tax=Heracleum sosnowskyi TaxID=360622 RepID=A0AAD8MPV3_9APIA|nr:hypothetical protein POM88_027148 [Heracleum sosnowskyi]
MHHMHQMDESINNSLKSITQTVLKRRHGSASQTNNALRSLDLNLESQPSNAAGTENADVVTPTPNQNPLKSSSNVLHKSVLNRHLNPIQNFARSPSNIHYHDKNKENLPPNTGKQISKLNGETLCSGKSKFVLFGSFLVIYKTFVGPRTPLGISQSPSLTPQSGLTQRSLLISASKPFSTPLILDQNLSCYEQPVSTSSIRSDKSSLAHRSNVDYLQKKINVSSLISPSARQLAEVYESLSEDEADNRENENENDEVPATEGSVKPAKKGSKRKRSIAWETFSFTTPAENEVKCKKCSYTITYNSSFGTGNMLKHQKLCATSSDVRQMIISKSQGTMMVHNGAFDPKVFRDMITDAVVRQNLPIQFVEYESIREAFMYANPKATLVSRNTLRSDILLHYKTEKRKDYVLFCHNSFIFMVADLQCIFCSVLFFCPATV